MLRVLFQRFAFSVGRARLLASGSNLLLTSDVSTSSTGAHEQNTGKTKTPERDPEKVKRAKLYDILIVSSIGIIGFGYLLIRRFLSSKVHAKSAEVVKQDSGLETVGVSGQKAVLNDEGNQETHVRKRRRRTFKESRV